MTALGKWTIPAPRKSLVVGVADMVVSNDPGAELVTYSLGSCLGITIYDPAKKIGGLFHVMLPDSKIDATKAVNVPFMFMDTGLPRLFHAAYNLGADRSRLAVKVAGGAQLLDERGVFNIGGRNFQALTDLIARNGLVIHARDVGGMTSRTLRFDLATGTVMIKSPGAEAYPL
jgi:chemotaxis protein CheD